MPEILSPVIPDSITVHLGAPSAQAQNVTVPFTTYIKNVASGEIYPTWPENALRANIYAIISYALNRIYTEWYPSQGYDFDITSVTAFDQSFSPDREIFMNISEIVDDIFNDYVIKQGSVEPYFTQFCNGTTSRCAGLSQWGTVDLANAGLTPYEILQNYYGQDIGIVENAPVQNIAESYPGVPLRLGDNGNDVAILQTQLNRIAQNYPAIPIIPERNAVFGTFTEAAVRKFQEIFSLPQTGVVDKATWYKIKRYYVGVKSLGDLVSEGVSLEEAQLPFVGSVGEGDEGIAVRSVQYYLTVIAAFNPEINPPEITGFFGPQTAESVRDFQSFYGLPVTGRVDDRDWITMSRIYSDSIDTLPADYSGQAAKLYPGYPLNFGMSGSDVTDLQNYLSFISDFIPEVPKVPVTGYFGEQTRNAATEFQRLFGLNPNGIVETLTWNELANQYNLLNGISVPRP